MKSNFPTIIIASFFIYSGLIGLVGCNNPTSPSTLPVPQGSTKPNQPNNVNSAPSITPIVNNNSNKNSVVQLIQPTNDNRNTTASSDVPSTYGSKTISPEEIRNIVKNSPNAIAAESNLEAALSNRQITIKSFKISAIRRFDDNGMINMMDTDLSDTTLLVVLFTEDQKQAILSLENGATVNVKCKYKEFNKAQNGYYRIFFDFESF